MQITFSGVEDLAALGTTWRALEAEVAKPCFYRTWSWVGCLAAERFPDPVLVRADEDGRLLGLALFNRRRRHLYLGESGNADLDAPFVEHNGPLHLPRPGIEKAMIQAAMRLQGTQRLVLSGVSASALAVPAGEVLRCQERPAPFVDLDAVRAAGGDHIATLSPGTRYQVRRSIRHYGELRLRQASSVPEALVWLDAMIALHERTWQARGQRGAFASDYLRRFHTELVSRTLARGELELLRLEAKDEVVGYLYNFRLGGRVITYQSGFAAAGRSGSSHAKPGLTCHVLAIQRAIEAGDRVYDFLAGAHRYKLSLSNASNTLFWAELVPRWSSVGVALRLGRRCGLLQPAGPMVV